MSLRTTWIRKNVTHLEVLNGRDVRTILHCVQQQLPANVYEAYVTTDMGNRRAHRSTSSNETSFWIHKAYRTNPPPLTNGSPPTASTSCQPDDILSEKPGPKTIQYQPPTFSLDRPTQCFAMEERI